MDYPLTLTFKVWAIAPQILVSDANDSLLFYVRQKLFKLKESINVFADTEQTKQLFAINADRIIDFSATYHFTDINGTPLGAVKRKGLRSLWRARYEILDNSDMVMTIQEKNPWIKVLDSLLCEIPVVGMFSGYFFNPTYLIARPDGTVVMHLMKQPSFWSRKFTVKAVNPLSEREENQIVLSLLMMLLLERNRG